VTTFLTQNEARIFPAELMKCNFGYLLSVVRSDRRVNWTKKTWTTSPLLQIYHIFLTK